MAPALQKPPSEVIILRLGLLKMATSRNTGPMGMLPRGLILGKCEGVFICFRWSFPR